MPPALEFEPATIGPRQVYRLLTGAVVPRPIGWASTVSKTGVANLAPFSFFTVVCVIPPMISFTIARNPDGTEKHTLKNVRDTGEFCFNVVTQDGMKGDGGYGQRYPGGRQRVRGRSGEITVRERSDRPVAGCRLRPNGSKTPPRSCAGAWLDLPW